MDYRDVRGDRRDHAQYYEETMTYAIMLQIAVHDRMILQLIETKSAYLCQGYPLDSSTPLYAIRVYP